MFRRSEWPALLILSALELIYFIANAQPSAYWRDSSELILSAAFLDIPHPAGFPLYNILANLLTLLPFGPIALRVNILSSIAATISCLMTYLIAKRLSSPQLWSMPVAIIVTFSAFLGSQVIFRQSGTAEVYQLNAALILVITYLAILYQQSRDLRYALACAFLSSIALTNHIVSLFIILPAALYLSLSREIWKRSVLVIATILIIMGLSLYSYLPLRSSSELPLDTGSPRSLKAVIYHLTDHRDTALRQDNGAGTTDLEKVTALPELFALVTTAQNDLKRALDQTTWVILIFLLPGVVTLALFNRQTLILITIIVVGAWYPFRGWDPEPWIPVIAIFNIVGVCGVFSVFRKLEGRTNQRIARILICAIALIPLLRKETILEASQLSSYREPADTAAELLKVIPNDHATIVETSWFIASYVHHIEGFRSDVEVIYLPKILYPDLFGETKYTEQNPQIPALDRLARIIDLLPQETSIWFEPSNTINSFLSKVATLDRGGLISLTRGSSGLRTEFLDFYTARADRLIPTVHTTSNQALKDRSHYWESRFNNSANLLAASGHISLASLILEKLCMPIDLTQCSEVSLNNLAVYLIKQGELLRARKALNVVLERGTAQRQVIEENLRLTE